MSMVVAPPTEHIPCPDRVANPPGNVRSLEIKGEHEDSKSLFPESVYSTDSQRRGKWTKMYDVNFIPKDYKMDTGDGGPTVFSATELKRISEDSKNVFPPSEYDSESVKNRRWKSIYDTDFNPRERANMGLKSRSASTGHYRNKPHPSKMFMQWKVPSRLTDGGLADCEPADEVKSNDLTKSLDKLRFQQPQEYRLPRPLDVTHTTHHSPPRSLAERKQTPFFPEIGNQSPRLNSRATESRMTVAQSAHSRLQSRASADHLLLGSRQGTAVSVRSAKPASSALRRSADFVDNAVNPDVTSKAHELLQNASPNEKRLIEKALRSAERRKLEKTLHKTLQPDAKDAVTNWLKTASEQDRKVAVKFFESLSGNKLMGSGSEEQNARIEQVINTLKKNKGSGMGLPNGYFRDDRARQLQYLRLLTPNTRDNRWMHTTWHHLPPYHDNDPVNNRSAIYSEMKAFLPRHFTIHPEWG